MKTLIQNQTKKQLPFLASAGLALLFNFNLSQAQIITPIPTLGGSSVTASALNDQGQVAGFSFLTGDQVQHGFLLSGGIMTDLGTLGGSQSAATGLNALGHVIGDSSTLNDLETHAFLFQNGSMIDLGTLGGTFSSAVAVNDLGQVAGFSFLGGNSESRAFLWDNGNLVDLGTLGGSFSTPVDINNQGHVAGYSFTAGNVETHAFLFRNGQMTDLGTLGGPSTMVFDLNDAGQVVGDSETSNFEIHACLSASGGLTDLGTLGGTFSTARAINELGQVVGQSSTPNDMEFHAFLAAGGSMLDLGTLGGSSSFATDINDQGLVVGDTIDSSGMMVAFLWQNGVMTDLNSLLPANSDWMLFSGLSINETGQILGLGIHQNLFAWFLLTLPSDNHPPVAQAGPDQSLQCPGPVTLNGSASSDPDGDPLTFAWTKNGVTVGQTAAISLTLAPGSHAFELTVTDPAGAADQDQVTVTIADLTPPTITCPLGRTLQAGLDCTALLPDLTSSVVAIDNCTDSASLQRSQSPPAQTVLGLGEYLVTVTVKDVSGNQASCQTRVVVVDAVPPVIASCPEPDPILANADNVAEVPDFLSRLEVSDNCTAPEAILLEQFPAAGSLVEVGTHLITLAATDPAGNQSTCTLTLTVKEPCRLVVHSLTATPNVISPPNKQMIPVTLTVQAESSCGEVACKITSVASTDPVSERRNDPAPDWVITGPLTLNVRAQISPQSDRRVYTITVLCSNSAKQETTRTVQVLVQKNKKTDSADSLLRSTSLKPAHRKPRK